MKNKHETINDTMEMAEYMANSAAFAKAVVHLYKTTNLRNFKKHHETMRSFYGQFPKGNAWMVLRLLDLMYSMDHKECPDAKSKP